MATMFADRVRVNTATTGVGTLTLGTAVAGFRSFSAAVTAGHLVSGATIYYCIEEGANWETGSGVYTAGPPDLLTRVVAASSAGGTTPITLAGAAQVYITMTAVAAATAPSQAADTNNTTVANTAFVLGQASSTTPTVLGTAAIGTSLRYARADHVHSNSLTNGINFGSVIGSSNTDLSKHIALWGSSYGISVTSNRLNIQTGGGTYMMVGASDVGSFTSTGLNACTIGATTRSTGAFTSVSVSATPTGNGSVQLLSGDGTGSGYCGFFNPAGTRIGYIGYASGGQVNLVANEGGSTQLTVWGNVVTSGTLTTSSNLSVSGTASVTGLLTAGQVNGGAGYGSKAGSTGGYSGNKFNFYWDGANIYAYIDNVQIGALAMISDRRIKQDIVDADAGALARVMQWRPVHFDFTNVGIFKASGRRQLGFIADELQAITPGAVNGASDAVNELGEIMPQSINDRALIAELTGAVQELAKRVAALEAKQAP